MLQQYCVKILYMAIFQICSRTSDDLELPICVCKISEDFSLTLHWHCLSILSDWVFVQLFFFFYFFVEVSFISIFPKMCACSVFGHSNQLKTQPQSSHRFSFSQFLDVDNYLCPLLYCLSVRKYVKLANGHYKWEN